jgi:ribonucleoside-diphosphate reductase alpha chain
MRHEHPAALSNQRHGAPLEKLSDLLADAKFEPCGPVSGHNRLKHYSSLPDLIVKQLLVRCCGFEDLAHV